jgi:cytochrome c peroxidase
VPVLFNLAWQTKFHWDGEFNSLYDEAAQPINGHIELAESFNGVINKLEKYPEYRGLFRKVFQSNFIRPGFILKA